jgi:UDP-3-O-[3-hydroxymyristoyl] N-acetylglucosamine deacetylase
MTNDKQQVTQTLAKPFERSGVGLHSGIKTQVRVLPTRGGEGRYFVRVDLPDQPLIPARVKFVHHTQLSTELAANGGAVRTVEHLLSALAGCGVDHARIEIDGGELPLLDGSAQEWVSAIAQSGTIPVDTLSPSPPPLQQPIWIYEGETFVAALPSPTTRFTYGIEFDLPAIGQQWYTWHPEQEAFESAIAPARTFGLAHQIDQLRSAGLIKGGSLDNALVCDANGWLNPPLRFANEPVRHKLLDLVGDLSLLGKLPQAHFLAYRASHKLHIQLANALATLLTSNIDKN